MMKTLHVLGLIVGTYLALGMMVAAWDNIGFRITTGGWRDRPVARAVLVMVVWPWAAQALVNYYSAKVCIGKVCSA